MSMVSGDEIKGWIRRISRLALVNVSPDEEERLANDIVKIINFFNKLREVNVENVEPMFMTPRKEPIVREDEPQRGLSQDEALSNVKEVLDGYVKGPKTI